ncbi:hypothetical protein LCGC14_1957360 [marine sediment metagenome]|uniref:Uncharacterized protein n=1 Tax=marine sediment metagenome TaxID=412755 RepID=A0A0F9FFU8_9ZZZZ
MYLRRNNTRSSVTACRLSKCVRNLHIEACIPTNGSSPSSTGGSLGGPGLSRYLLKGLATVEYLLPEAVDTAGRETCHNA